MHRRDRPGPGRPGQRMEKRLLAVALQAGQSDQLAGVELQVDRLGLGVQYHSASAQHHVGAPGPLQSPGRQ